MLGDFDVVDKEREREAAENRAASSGTCMHRSILMLYFSATAWRSLANMTSHSLGLLMVGHNELAAYND